MLARTFTVLALGLLAAAPALADEVKKEMEKLKGSWTVVSAERGGEPNERAKNDKLVFDGDKVIVKRTNKDDHASFKLDPAKKPKEIDIIPTEGNRKDQPHPGIYELDGDNLKICFTLPGEDRPKEFNTKDKPQAMCVVLKRDK